MEHKTNQLNQLCTIITYVCSNHFMDIAAVHLIIHSILIIGRIIEKKFCLRESFFSTLISFSSFKKRVARKEDFKRDHKQPPFSLLEWERPGGGGHEKYLRNIFVTHHYLMIIKPFMTPDPSGVLFLGLFH